MTSLKNYVEIQAYFELDSGLTTALRDAIGKATASGKDVNGALWSCYAVNEEQNMLSAHFVTKSAPSMISGFEKALGNLKKFAKVQACYVHASRSDLGTLKDSSLAKFHDAVEYYEIFLEYIRFKEIAEAVAFDFLYCVPFFTLNNGIEDLKVFVDKVEAKELKMFSMDSRFVQRTTDFTAGKDTWVLKVSTNTSRM